MTRAIPAVVLLLVLHVTLLAYPATAEEEDLIDMLQFDATGGALELFPGGDSYVCVSWDLGRPAVLGRRRMWLDLYRPTQAPGLGASIDINAGRPGFVGIGYIEGWHILVGAHIEVRF